MANKDVFVQYLTHPPIKIQTHFDKHSEPRQRPLTSVADVLGAYPRDSLLADTPIELLSLHRNSVSLRPDTLVADLVATSKNPLVIKCHGARSDSAAGSGSNHSADHIWKSVVCIACSKFSGTAIIIDKTDSFSQIYTWKCALLSLTMTLGTGKIKHGKYNESSKDHPDTVSSKPAKESSNDPIKVELQRYSVAPQGLELVLQFVLEPATCWQASARMLSSDARDIAITIEAEATVKDVLGHIKISALSSATRGLSGSVVVCTTRREIPIGFLANGGFGSQSEQHECYGYGIECLPNHLPRFLKGYKSVPRPVPIVRHRARHRPQSHDASTQTTFPFTYKSAMALKTGGKGEEQ
ncbi:hypothetical protein BDR26DRAFT_945947 [Obelidium mucronatum]|nr:hypothetical protein BDR26DRAFT_945947 [Obelidium mucronatum]